MSNFHFAGLLIASSVAGAALVGCSREPASSPVAVEEEIVDVEVPAVVSSDEADAMAELDDADRVAAMAQKVCPVSDQALGSMGTPLKVTIEGRDVFICCEGCREELLAHPDQYLAKLDTN